MMNHLSLMELLYFIGFALVMCFLAYTLRQVIDHYYPPEEDNSDDW